MRILAIDPGPAQSALLVYDGEAKRVLEAAILPNSEILECTAFGRAEHMAVEMIASYGMAVGEEVFETCVWIGRFIEHRDQFTHGFTPVLPAVKVYRKDVKLHLCGSPRAKDANIRQALMDRFGGKAAVGTTKARGPLYGVRSHLWSALAVAVFQADALKAGAA